MRANSKEEMDRWCDGLREYDSRVTVECDVQALIARYASLLQFEQSIVQKESINQGVGALDDSVIIIIFFTISLHVLFSFTCIHVLSCSHGP